MSELRFDRILTGALLAVSVWYAVTMFSYPANAGRIPGMVAVIAIGTLIVQLLLSFRSMSRAADMSVEPNAVSSVQGAPAVQGGSSIANVHLVEAQVLEQDSYDNLLALRGPRLRRLILISGFTVAYFVAALLVGFVLATTALIPALLLLSGERVRVAAIAAVAGAVSSYLLVVPLLGLPLLDGFFFGG